MPPLLSTDLSLLLRRTEVPRQDRRETVNSKLAFVSVTIRFHRC